MITLSIDEKDAHVLRVSASYLLALAAVTQVTAEDANTVANLHNQLVEAASGYRTSNPAVEDQTFNVHEIKESYDFIAPTSDHSDDAHAYVTGGPTAAEVFGAGKSVHSIAAVNPSMTAPVDTTAITSIPTPPGVLSPPAQPNDLTVAHVAALMDNPANPVELDINGLPWDARIHSREKTKLASGAWKYKRGVPSDTLAAVEAELGQLMNVPVSPPLLTAAVIVPPPPTATTVPPPPASIAPPANPSNPLEPFVKLMTKVSSAIADGKITAAAVSAIVNANGVASIGLMSSRLDLIPQVEAAIDATIAAGTV